MIPTISALAGRLAELHASVRIVESDTHRLGPNPSFASRLAALTRAVEQVEQQIINSEPQNEWENTVLWLLKFHRQGLAYDGYALPGGLRVEDFCGGAYTERPAHPQLSLSF